MSKSAKTLTWIVLIAVLTAVAGWYYSVQSGHQEVLAQKAEESLDSAITLFQQKQYAEALEILATIPTDIPRGWLALYYQGSANIMLKDYTTATASLEQALALNPTETSIMHALGVAYFKLGNLKMSKAYYAKVLETNPNDEEAKGLMDIMTSLEKQQPGFQGPETNEDFD